MSEISYEALRAAVDAARHAPSIFNTQPWWWRIDGKALELHADEARRLEVVDSAGTQLLLSCGAALHHARMSLAADGWAVEVQRLRPGGAAGEALARLRLLGREEPDPAAVMLRDAIPRRRTDRRPFGERTVGHDAIDLLAAAARNEGAHLHRVRLDQMPLLAIAVAAAGSTELASYRYRNELMRWTNRPEWSDDGVPPATAVRHVPRRVAVRAFTLSAEEALPVSPGGDIGASFFVLHGEGHDRLDWLRAGEALSAVLLTAVSIGLAVAPFTDVLEVEHPRDLVRGLLPGAGHPYVVIRCGYRVDQSDLALAPRRGLSEVLRADPAPVRLPPAPAPRPEALP